MTARRPFAVLAILVLTAAAAGALVLRQEEKKPLDEDALFAEAEKRFNAREFAEAERLFEEYLSRFPAGKKRESVSFQRAVAEYHQRKFEESREHFVAFQKDFPKSENAAWAQYHVARSLADQRRKDEAVAAYKLLFKTYPNTPATENALWQFWNLVDKSFHFSVYQSFTEGEEIAVNYTFRNIDRVKYRIFRLPVEEVAKKVEKADRIGNVQQLLGLMPHDTWKKMKEWEEEPKGERRYHYGHLKLPIEEAGFYILQAEHEEIAVHVNVIVARYGIVLKTAKGRTLAFAVDRRTSKPLAGMKIRAFDRGGVVEGLTDGQGLWVLDRETNGTVVGIRDGELALSNVSTYLPAKELKAYLFTDRPVYRPNQTVSYKGILTEYDSGRVEVLARRKAHLEIRDAKGNTLLKTDVSTNEFGSFAGEVVLGDEPALGFYRMTLRTDDDGYAYGQFRVEEYRKPEYRVDVKYPKGPHLQGETVTAEIQANYYFGSPVVDAEVNWVVTRRPHWRPYWHWRWDPYDWDLDDESPYGKRGRYYREEEVTRGTGRTGSDGRLAVSFQAPPSETDMVYTVRARAVDKSRREVEGSGNCKATRALVELSVSANRWVYSPGDSVTLKVRATDTDGQALRDVRVRVTAATSHWKRDGDRGAWEHREFYAGSTSTDENGLADLGFTVEKEGYVRVQATAEDRKGNKVSSDLYVWVSGRSWSGDFTNFNGIEIVPDKTSYKVGETAKILLASQHKGVHALVTLECDGIYRHQVVHIQGHTALVEIPIDRAEFAPNVYVSVTALVKNEFVQRAKTLSVPPAEKLLDVKVTMNQNQYRPRDPVTVTVEVKDRNGKPVRGEFAVSIVDEAIYAIQEEVVRDFRKFLYSRRWNRVQTVTSLHYVDHGRAQFGQKDEGGGRMRGDSSKAEEPGSDRRTAEKKGKAETETRSEFPDTMFWRSQVVTDENGRATFELKMADSLTTWRTTVRGLTGDAKVGQQTHSVICRKEVIVRLETPRFFTQNDESVVSAVVHNYRYDVDEIQVVIEAEGVELVGAKETVIRLRKNEDKRVDWKVRVKRAGTATFTAKALSEKESDAMRLRVPILPHGAPRFEAKAGMVEASQTIRIAVPDTAIPEASELRIAVSPSVASQILEALDYLAGYPYGCVEQTMSRFLPSVVTARTLRGLGLRNEKLEKELPLMVSQGLQRLYNFQHSDGGWGWWEADQSHPYMTAYVVYGLSQARDADFAVEPNALARGAEFLAKQLAGNHPLDTKAYLAFVLTEAGTAPKEALLSLHDHRGDLNNYSKALLASALHKAGEADRAQTVLANLDETAKVGEGYCYWESQSTKHHWMDNNIECTAYALKAMIAIDPKNEKMHKVVRWLSAKRQGSRWVSTKDTAAAVFALSEYIAHTKELEADYTLNVKLNGERLLSERITKDNLLKFDGTRVLKAGQFAHGANEITIEKVGSGNLYYSVYLRYYESREDFEPSKGAIRIDRSYARISWDGGRRIAEPLKSGETVKSGEEVEVTLRIECDGNYEYVMIEDPIPAGFEVVKEDAFYGLWGCRGRWRWWYSRIEARDDRVCVAATYLRGGSTIQYTMRAETPGDFHVLPTYAYNMYANEIAGSGGEIRIKVEDK